MHDAEKTREQLLEELAEAHERLAKLQRFCGDLDAFAYTVAHDLKRPLSLILGHTNLLLEEWETVPLEELRSHLETIARSGHRMNGIINDLMLLVHVRDEEEVKSTPLDMGGIVVEALERLNYIIRRRRVEVALPTCWPEALGYAPWVEEVWYAFISETLRLDAGPMHIQVGADEEAGENARFWIRVDDREFTSEQRDRLSEIYGGFRSDLVARVLKKLGGTYGAMDSPSGGTALYFTLPAKR